MKTETEIPLWVEQLAGSWDKIADASYDFRYPFDHLENIYASVHKMLAQQLKEDARKQYQALTNDDFQRACGNYSGKDKADIARNYQKLKDFESENE